MAKIFVGIPTLNRPDYVRQAVQSLRGQTCADWRAVVSDNASAPDASVAVRTYLEALADPRIHYWRQTKNIREYGNCEWLFRQCREEYFVILHDDDCLEPTHLESALKRLDAEPGVAAFCPNARIMDVEGRVSPELTRNYVTARGRNGVPDGPIRILEPLLRTGFVPICGTVIRSEALHRSGFVDDDCFGLWPFEVNLLLRLGETGAKAWYTSEPLVRYRYHPGQMQRYQGISADPVAVGMILSILERRRYEGEAERLRRRLIGMFYNFRARIAVRRDDMAACRVSLRRGIHANFRWAQHWPLAACAFLAPPLTRWLVRRVDARPPREL